MTPTHLGFYNTASSRTHVRFQFSTHAGTGGNVAPLSAFEAADLRIYKAADGAAFSATQRSSANGITMTSPFDSLTGFHDVDIDLTDNTDAGFYAAGGFYSVVLAPDTETIDGQTITGLVLAYFEIGAQSVNVTQFGGSDLTAASGIPEVKVASVANDAITAAALDSSAGAEIADAVWDEDLSGHLGAGSTGEALDAAAGAGTPPTAADIADAVWDEDLTGHVAADSAGETLGSLGTASDIADALLRRHIEGGADGTRTVTEALQAIRNKTEIAAGTLTVYESDDTTPSWTAGVTTAAGDPVTVVDPA